LCSFHVACRDFYNLWNKNLYSAIERSSRAIFFQEMGENVPYNANIVPTSWGGGICICIPLTKIWGKASHPSPLWICPWYSGSSLGGVGIKGHILYQLPLNGWKLGGRFFSFRGSWYKWPFIPTSLWTGEVDIEPNLWHNLYRLPPGRLKPP